MTRMIGSVKWFDSKKGYGFIDINGTDTFVHFSEIQSDSYKKLFPGEYVECEINDEQEKTRCVNVTGVNGGKLLIQNENYRYKVFPVRADDESNPDSNLDDTLVVNDEQ